MRGTVEQAISDAIDEINRLRIELAGKETESLGYLKAVGELQKRNDDAADEIERLRKALEPFADEAACYDPDNGDGDDTVWATPAYFKIRDLRRARAALDAVKDR
ncbi:hypothetical protein FHT87_005236 [Rhizobium sp. BK316]|uniref:hypothetical protein n=1 Tax=Rhizobium sp. BK316 TaxID=2587053 RepID=UPI001618692B|nr:hypothetical protein [Rhizobium sp. BK316]MBB3411283.1 hypothetical protein [Rhizobium sp. BK316]